MADSVCILPPAPDRPPASLKTALDADTVGHLLGALASRPGPLPKYRYPSAGTLYPVQTYLVLRRDFGALAAGSYYYDPEAHALVLLSTDLPAAPDATAPEALLMLVAQMAAIESIYRDEAETFCLLESGYMSEALRQAADGLTLRLAGDPSEGGHARFAEAFRLEPGHRPLVCWAVEGGNR
jgi:SagB-type dehydrogenase family enzyme